MDATCVDRLLPLPVIPNLTNASISSDHPSYEPASGGLAQIISSRLAEQTFSIDDLRTWLNRIASNEKVSWSGSEIIKMKPVPSIMAYTIVSLCLCLILSLTFCIVSCVNCRAKASYQRKRPIGTYICIGLLVLVYLLGIGDGIYVAFRVKKSTSSIDQTIKEINGEIYPKEIAEHLTYINEQIRRLDDYSSRPDSILINASKSMLDTTFKDILRVKYFLPDLLQRVNETNEYLEQLNTTVCEDPDLPPPVKSVFDTIKNEHYKMIDYLNRPLQELCDYNNATDTDIDRELLKALDSLHQVLKKVIKIIDDDILQNITPWENHLLISKDLQSTIRHYVNLAGTIVFDLIIALVAIPLVFFILICSSRLCCAPHNQREHLLSNSVPLEPRYVHAGRYLGIRSRQVAAESKEMRSSSRNPSGVCLCLIRLAFVVMFIMVIVLAVLTGVYYAADLSLQGSCRMVHHDQSFLVSFILDEFVTADTSLGNGTDLNTTVIQIIDACRERKHFSETFLNKYWTDINRGIGEMMNTLNGRIYNQFQTSLGSINLPGDISRLTNFSAQANNPNITGKVKQMATGMDRIQQILLKVNSSDASLPPGLVDATSERFRNYSQQLFESTIDACPLPLSTLYQTDTLICHDLANSLNGLWLSVFLCLMIVLFGLCIFGLCIYKRPSGSWEDIYDDSNQF